MTKFLFVRHGQSEGNATGYIATATTKLTDVGVEQARKTAKELKHSQVDIIASSPMIRAQQTAETIAGELGIGLNHIKIIDELQERGLGDLEGKPKDHESAWYPIFDNEYNAETRKMLIERMKNGILKIEKLAQGNKIVLVVGHAISGYHLIEVASGHTKIEDFEPVEEILNASIVEVEIGKNWGEL